LGTGLQTDLVAEIAVSTKVQASEGEAVKSALGHIDTVAQRNAMVEETGGLSNRLATTREYACASSAPCTTA